MKWERPSSPSYCARTGAFPPSKDLSRAAGSRATKLRRLHRERLEDREGFWGASRRGLSTG